MTLRVELVTLFPEMVEGALKFGVLGRAIERGPAECRYGRSAPSHAGRPQDRGRPALRRRAPEWC